MTQFGKQARTVWENQVSQTLLYETLKANCMLIYRNDVFSGLCRFRDDVVSNYVAIGIMSLLVLSCS